ncbi:carbonate dehydratase [Bordetella sp. H567]|uniref:cation-translocating P-type ATPase n=1 Tax=Bordetella sp. H567 TaxID=1697043 RepID=UPI00081C536B|nr:HAD-IC family P-type ATPase [Bordetella sp. H567]AOB31428.1 carbonate dehydratase [Bordetella sp. H567]
MRDVVSPQAVAVPAAPWHALPRRNVADRIGATREGLTSTQAAERLRLHGANRLGAPPRPGVVRRFLAQINSFFIYVLLACAGGTLALGDYVDTSVILAVVLVNAVAGLLQEQRAETALAAIRNMLAPTASVQRDGQRLTVPAVDLVQGDIIHLEGGDKVPADARLLRAHGLLIQEAPLTGESAPVEKSVGRVPETAPLAERTCMAYAGTLIVGGSATAMVVACGVRTELGRISDMVAGTEPTRTPLLRKMDRFTRTVTAAVLAVDGAIIAIDVMLRGRTADEALLRGIGIAVAAIPEGLPAVLAVTLAIGVRHMAVHQAIIRHLPAVEALGAVTTICSDKTGTMTRNEMTVQAVGTADATYEVTGSGYAPAGQVLFAGEPMDSGSSAVLSALAQACALCVDASTQERDGQWTVSGDPMEGALIVLAGKIHRDAGALAGRMPRIDEVPFDSRSRYMATLHRSGAGTAALYVKGAPERIVAMCSTQRTEAGDAPLDPAHWHTLTQAMASQGHRVIAVATRDMGMATRLSVGGAESGLTLLGLLGLVDPPRPDAITAVQECRHAGIAVKMITGDHPETARWVARRLHLAWHENVITGARLDRLSDEALRELISVTDVFARTTPEHKLRLVTALQAHGEIVAMTGDGVNDAPALKRADVGVAMGRKGTEAAKESASIVLLNDDFASIVAAVREGRTVYDNVAKAIAWTLPTHGGQALFVAAAILLGITLPITPTQILWVNTATSATLALTLAFEPAEAGIMRRPPRPPHAPLLTGRVAWRVAIVSLLFMAAAFSMYEWALWRGLETERAQTIVVNTIVAMDVFYLFSVRFLETASLTWIGVRGTPAVLWGVGTTLLLQLAMTYLPAMQSLFHTRALSFIDNAAVLGIGVLFFLVLEAEKRLHAFYSSSLCGTSITGHSDSRT